MESHISRNRVASSSNAPVSSADLEINERIAALDQQAVAHYSRGHFGKCVEVLRVAYQLRKGILGKEHVDTLLNLNNLAAALGRHGMLQEAEEAFRDALLGRIKVKGAGDAECLTTMNHLGIALKQLGQFEESDTLLYTALSGFFSQRGVKHICTAEVAFPFGVLAVQQGRRNKAAYLFGLAALGLTASLGAAHQHTRDAEIWKERCEHTYKAVHVPVSAPSSSFSFSSSPNKFSKSPGKESAFTMVQPINIPSPHAPLLSPFELEDLDYTEQCYVSKKHWKHRSSCVVCSISYSLTRREHHCRVCGGSACDDCTQATTYMLEFGLKTKVRMCSVCEAQGFA